MIPIYRQLMSLGKMILVAVGGVVALFFAAIGIATCGKDTDPDRGGRTQTTQCDASGVKSREDWIDAPNRLREDMATPTGLGFRIDGPCADILRDRQLDCAKDAIAGVDSPYLREALTYGFTTYQCELVGSNERVNYPLRDIVAMGEAMNRPKPPADAGVAKPKPKKKAQRPAPQVREQEVDDPDRMVFPPAELK